MIKKLLFSRGHIILANKKQFPASNQTASDAVTLNNLLGEFSQSDCCQFVAAPQRAGSMAKSFSR